MKSHVPLDLTRAGRETLTQARESTSGRAAQSLLPQRGAGLTQTILALRSGSALTEHTAPGAATLQILAGAAHLESGGTIMPLRAGDWVTIPSEAHTLYAVEDLVALLTVSAE